MQQTLLETEAYLNYIRVTLDISESLKCQVSVDAFVHTIDHAQQLQAMHIRCWLIHSSETVVQTICVKAVTTLCHFQDTGLSVKRFHNSLPIYQGPASSVKHYKAIKSHGHNCIHFPDPFHAQVTPKPLSSINGPLCQTQEYRVLTIQQWLKKSTSDSMLFSCLYQYQFNTILEGQSRFKDIPCSKLKDPDCKFYPPPLLAWAEAQLNVNPHPSQFYYEQMNSDSVYVVPKPAFMVATEREANSCYDFNTLAPKQALTLSDITLSFLPFPTNHPILPIYLFLFLHLPIIPIFSYVTLYHPISPLHFRP